MRKPNQPVSFRQVKIAREHATAALLRFLQSARPELLPTGPTAVESLGGALVEFIEAGLEILSAIAKQEDPPESALAILTKALNRPVKEFVFHFFGDPPEYRIDERMLRMRQGDDIFIAKGPYWITMDPVRNAAEGLREYLELIPICGMIHSACRFEGCLRPVIGGRGNKKFCSDEHRKAFWTYDRQRDYFQRKQRETYRVRKVTKKGAKKHGRQR